MNRMPSSLGFCLSLVVIGTFLSPALGLTDANWKDDVSGTGSDPTKWDIGAVPGSSHYVYLPIWDGNLYTVTVDGSWTIGDLSTYWNSTVSLGSNTLTSNNGAYIRGTLDIRGGQFNNDGSGNMSLASTSKIIGYGTIGQPLTGDDGEIRAQGTGQTLSIEFYGNTHNDATLIADDGATLYVRNTPADYTVVSYAVTDLNGGTLKGYQYYNYYQWVLDGTSGDHAKIQGHGTVDRFLVGATDYAEINANDTNASLTLNQGFVNATYNQILTVSNNATFNVLQDGYAYWNFDGTGTMTGGSITGDQFRQRGDMAYSAGTNTIGDAILYDNSIGTNTVSNGATLRTNGQVYLENVTIAESGSGGYFNVYGGTTEGRGNVYPDTTVSNGAYLKANDGGQTLAVHGTFNNQGNTLASDGGTLNLNGSTTNAGNLYAISGGTVNLAGDLVNNGSIYTQNNGTGNLVTVSDLTPQGSGTFTANTNGTIRFGNGVSNALLSNVDSWVLAGGLMTVDSGTMTNAAGKRISGYGTLLETGKTLSNAGELSAAGGTLTVTGPVTNTGTGVIKSVGSGNTINVNGDLTNGHDVYAQSGGVLNLPANLVNNGYVYALGSGSTGLVTVADTTPSGTGYFTAYDQGTVQFAAGTTNSGMTDTSPFQLLGGKITTASGNLTNAAGKDLTGYGQLMDSGKTVINYGRILPSGGSIAVLGNLENHGQVTAGGGNGFSVGGTTTNVSGATITNNGPGTMTFGNLTNEGTLEILGGGGGMVNGTAAGSGKYLLDQATLTIRGNWEMSPMTQVDDQDTACTINVNGNLNKAWDHTSSFHLEHSTVNFFSPAMAVMPHKLLWEALDLGPVEEGLDNNLALGMLTFGDNLGLPESDMFQIMDGSTLYCYGLSLRSDVDLDLGGNTIYYLPEGMSHNGIQGMGFEDLGANWYNGSILPIPEPMTMILLLIGLVGLRRKA